VVSIRIPGGESPGEVRVYVRGTYELFIAYTEEAGAAGCAMGRCAIRPMAARVVIVRPLKVRHIVGVERFRPGGPVPAP